MTWITDNIGTIVVLMALAAAVTAIIIWLVRDKRKGKSSCGCNCAGCSLNGKCHGKTSSFQRNSGSKEKNADR